MSEHHVVLVDGSGDLAGWLSPGCRLVNAAWEAGRFARAEAEDLAGFARRHIRISPDSGCTWQVVAATDVARDHYGTLLTQAQEPEVGCDRCGASLDEDHQAHEHGCAPDGGCTCDVSYCPDCCEAVGECSVAVGDRMGA